jgi:Zn finger protein HypA/HybF involved in hydrogenase expression
MRKGDFRLPMHCIDCHDYFEDTWSPGHNVPCPKCHSTRTRVADVEEIIC